MSAGPEEIARALERLSGGGVVAFPTETVYGLGADALSGAAVRRVFELKGRPSNNPLIVHVSGAEMAREMVVAAWPAEAEELARAFWPGPLTLVLPKAGGIPDEVTCGGPTVGVRCPDHAVTLTLLDVFGRPLVGPSANPSGGVSPTRAEHVAASFSEEQVLVLDGGACRGGIESTVLWLAGGPVRILRPGLATAEEIEGVLGVQVGRAGGGARVEGEVLASPGMLERHYAPSARAVRLSESEMPELLARLAERSAPVVVLACGEVEVPRPHVVIGMPGDAAGFAARLYDALRTADAGGPSMIAVVLPEAARGKGLWAAVEDRVRRATTAWDGEA